MNNQNSILLIDPKFDPITSINCNLLLKLGMDCFSYAIIDKALNKVIAVFDEQECEDMSKVLIERLKNDVYLGLTFNEIKIAVYTENNVSIPNELYKSEDLKLSAHFFKEKHVGILYTNVSSDFGFTSVFSYAKLTDEIITQSLSNSKKYHLNTPILKLAGQIDHTSLLLDFTAGSVSILYIKDKQVVFQQCYEISDAEEFTYYLLLIVNQFNISLTETTVYCCGIIHQEDEKYNCLKTYFINVLFLNFVDYNLDQQVLEDMPTHYYTTLLTLDQCV